MRRGVDHARHFIELAGMPRERMVDLLQLALTFDDGAGMPREDAELRKLGFTILGHDQPPMAASTHPTTAAVAPV